MTVIRNSSDSGLDLLVTDDLSIHPLIRDRVSHGGFERRRVAAAHIVALLQAARRAPSSFNSQPWRFVVVERDEERPDWDTVLCEWGAPWAVEAPVLIAVIVDWTVSTELHGLNYALFDVGMAVENLLLQACSMGLATHPVGFDSADAVRNLLHLPASYTPLLLVAVGWPTPVAAVTRSRRHRKPLAAMATWRHWDGNPVVED